jgi:hypothetical protein
MMLCGVFRIDQVLIANDHDYCAMLIHPTGGAPIFESAANVVRWQIGRPAAPSQRAVRNS